MAGPGSISREARWALAQELCDRARQVHGDGLKAVGLYGSMARGQDGPYSDIEMLCVLRQPGAEFTYEWAYGPGKAEVDFYGEDVLLQKAAEVEGRWPLTHGSFHHVRPLYDPEGFFSLLHQVAAGRTDEQFHAAIEGVLVGEMYEFVGKLRNMPHTGTAAYLPELALQMAKYGAFLVGLHNRRYFSTGARVLDEALAMPNRPAGFDALCRLVLAGTLSDRQAVADACERFWEGTVEWARQHGYAIDADRRIPF